MRRYDVGEAVGVAGGGSAGLWGAPVPSHMKKGWRSPFVSL